MPVTLAAAPVLDAIRSPPGSGGFGDLCALDRQFRFSGGWRQFRVAGATLVGGAALCVENDGWDLQGGIAAGCFGSLLGSFATKWAAPDGFLGSSNSRFARTGRQTMCGNSWLLANKE